MRVIASLPVVLLLVGLAYGIPGDLDLDGDVDFDDFFAFGDQFGKTGPPETLRVVVADTVLRDSLVVVLDTLTVQDTVTQVRYDTLVIVDTAWVEFVAPPADVAPGEWVIPGLDSIAVRLSAEDPDRDGTTDGLEFRVRFYHLTGDPFRPYESLFWTNIWWDVSYTLSYFRATGGEPESIELKRGVVRSHSSYMNMIVIRNSAFLPIEVKQQVFNSGGYLVVEGVVRTPMQGDYYFRSELPVEFDRNANWQ